MLPTTYHRRHGVVTLVRHAEREFRDSSTLRQLSGSAVQYDLAPSFGRATHLYRSPTDRVGGCSTKGLERRLLRREARGEPLGTRAERGRTAIGDFGVG